MVVNNDVGSGGVGKEMYWLRKVEVKGNERWEEGGWGKP